VTSTPEPSRGAKRARPGERKKILLRLDPLVHDALARWAADELRSTNAQIEFLLRKALADARRLPAEAGRMRGPGRPRKPAGEGEDDDTGS
jgi:hypothetical protein